MVYRRRDIQKVNRLAFLILVVDLILKLVHLTPH
jgi:hypothetical protein